MEDDNEPITIPLYPKCTRRGCKGSVDFPDMSEVYDGQRGRCDTCGRAHVAIEYPNSMRVQHDAKEDRKAHPLPRTPKGDRWKMKS